MTKKSNINKQEKQLKELTFQKAKEIGKTFQELATSDIKLNEVNEMDEKIQEGIKQNLIVDRLRKLINKINTDKLDDVPIPENSPYKYAYYLYLLAQTTNNINLIEYAKKLKEKVLHEENE